MNKDLDIILKMSQTIFIKDMNGGGTCTFFVDLKNQKVKELIKKYAEKINEKEENISLVFAGKLLQTYLQRYLHELSIQPNSTLMSVMRLKIPETIIFIKNMNGGTCTFFVDLKNQKVKELLKKYAEKINEKEENISLVFAGKLLQTYLQNYLYEVSIQPNSTLMSVMKLKCENGKIVKIIINDVNNKEHQIEFNDDKTGNQLKQYIYKNLCQSLEPNLMSLKYAGVDIQNNKKLSYYKLVKTSGIRKIIQSKQSLGKIPGIILAYETDPFGCDQETYRMPCGHVVGTEGMTAFIRSLVVARQFQINCPANKPNGERCNYEWEYETCRKIGVFTAEQNQLFQEGLSKNWIMRNSSECPKCQVRMIKGQLKSNRVKCSNCKFGDYCYECSQMWKSSDFELCGNTGCSSSFKKILNQAEWNLPFRLKNNKKIQIYYMLPSIRSCPGCHRLHTIDGGDKHYSCRLCKMQFCWACLAVKTNGSWPCGGAFDYCGKIAQTQQYQ